MRHPNRSWRVDETYIRVAGQWIYLYRAVDSAGQTIDFLLSPKRDRIAAKGFLQLALSGQTRPRVINVDGHPAYPAVIDDLKRSGELGRRCQSRLVMVTLTDTPVVASRWSLKPLQVLRDSRPRQDVRK